MVQNVLQYKRSQSFLDKAWEILQNKRGLSLNHFTEADTFADTSGSFKFCSRNFFFRRKIIAEA